MPSRGRPLAREVEEQLESCDRVIADSPGGRGGRLWCVQTGRLHKERCLRGPSDPN
jgi:hypothetical protein